MKCELSNSHLFYAYHIRSAFLVFEQALRKLLNEMDVTLENFYILQCDWGGEEASFEDIKAHAILSDEEARLSVNNLIIKGYIVEGAKDGFYALSSEGSVLRTQLLEAYYEHVFDATKGLSEPTIETALSSLLRFQDNLQRT